VAQNNSNSILLHSKNFYTLSRGPPKYQSAGSRKNENSDNEPFLMFHVIHMAWQI